MIDSTRARYSFVLIAIAAATIIQADPPEHVNAWTAAPHGWHLDQLGPQTRNVDPAEFGGVIHVSSTGSDEGSSDGSTTSPYRTLNSAMDRAAALVVDSGPIAVLVAEGEYRGSTIRLVSDVHLFGGFDPENWERNVQANQSILDGGEKNRVLIGADDASDDIDGQPRYTPTIDFGAEHSR